MAEAHELIQPRNHRGGAVRLARKEWSPYLGEAEREDELGTTLPFGAPDLMSRAAPLARMGDAFSTQTVLGMQRQLGNTHVQRLLMLAPDRIEAHATPMQRTGLVMRRCGCGGTITEGTECAGCRAQRVAAESGFDMAAGPSTGVAVRIQRGWWDDVTAAAGDVAGGVSTAAGDVVAGVSEAGSDIAEGATKAYGSAARGDYWGAATDFGSGVAEAGEDLGEGAYGAVTDLKGGVSAAASDIWSGAPVTPLWTCDASCNVEGTAPHCTGRVTGSGNGPNEEQACREAKRDAVHKAPRGCYARHCQCKNCQR